MRCDNIARPRFRPLTSPAFTGALLISEAVEGGSARRRLWFLSRR